MPFQHDLLSPGPRVLSVTELNCTARALIERELPLLWVAGEISNLTRAASGHLYFSLKDAQAQVRCVLFRQKAQWLNWKPENGMQIEVRACPSFYEPRGEFQLTVEVMRRSGLGALYEAYERLKAKLEGEGLFDPATKQALPAFPRRIGVVTSLQAAALRDVLTTLRRCMAAIPVVVYPTAVQGPGAGQQIAAAIAMADSRAECDVLIVCRGGGSIEDLWAFNEEVVARALHACGLPVICGVGHETDFTIADFVADARAPTPTAAAQMAAPNCEELLRRISNLHHRLLRVTERTLERRMQQLDILVRRLVHPGERIAQQRVEVAHLARRVRRAWHHELERCHWQVAQLERRLLAAGPDLAVLGSQQRALARRLMRATTASSSARDHALKSLASQLAHLNPRAVLERGYSMVENARGEIVHAASQVQPEEELKLTFAAGGARARVLART